MFGGINIHCEMTRYISLLHLIASMYHPGFQAFDENSWSFPFRHGKKNTVFPIPKLDGDFYREIFPHRVWGIISLGAPRGLMTFPVGISIGLVEGKKNTGHPHMFMVKTMVSCRFALKPIQ